MSFLHQASRLALPALHKAVGCTHQHLLAGAMQSTRALITTSNNQTADLPCVAGTIFRVSSKSSPVDIQTKSGDVAHIQAPSGGGWSWKLVGGQSAIDRPVIEVTQIGTGGTPGILQAFIPEKHVSVEVESHGEGVNVSKVTEANLTIVSQGGDVTLGQVRALNVGVDTTDDDWDGSLQGGEVSGTDVVLKTGEAGIRLQRVVGKRVQLEVGRRPLDIRALYGEQVEAFTTGGPVDLGLLDASDQANVYSNGGEIVVHSLDGNVKIDSNGGRIEVHLQSKVGQVQLSSCGGDVRVAISPQAVVEVVVMGKGPVRSPEPEIKSDDNPDQRTYLFNPQLNSSNIVQKPARYGTLSKGRVVVESQGAPVDILRVGWMDALKQRLTATTNITSNK